MRFCSSHGGGKVAEVFKAIIVASFDTPGEKEFRVINGIAAGGREGVIAMWDVAMQWEMGALYYVVLASCDKSSREKVGLFLKTKKTPFFSHRQNVKSNHRKILRGGVGSCRVLRVDNPQLSETASISRNLTA